MIRYLIPEREDARIFNRQESLSMRMEGSFAASVRFIDRNQICDVGLLQKFVNVFRVQTDGAPIPWVSWRSEFWGKMMRGASMVVKYTQSKGMYRILEQSVRELLTAQDELGRISGFSVDCEFTKWDLWGRKYVMLGIMYFMEICDDEELSREITASLCRQADYILARVGPGKLDIRTCSEHWEGMNSCSILEPMVRLYRITAEKRYLDFAEYIISTGFIQSDNLIELALRNEVAPHQYPVVKAYEMMSCFEGLLQYYCITGVEKYKTAVLNFGYRILSGELSIIGCSGCTHELFDHTAIKQTQTDYKGVVQETCVTVTWMKLAAALLELSGDPAFADAIERSYYNAYIGSFNLHRVPFSDFEGLPDVPQVLPFDSYSPLTANTRGRYVGGYERFPDHTFYGCCACIGAAGAGVIPQMALLNGKDALILNHYEKGILNASTPAGSPLQLTLQTNYPYDGSIRLSLRLEQAERFSLLLRIPAWCRMPRLTVNGREQAIGTGYATVGRLWSDGDLVELKLPMPVRQVLPPEGACNRELFAAYCRGPLVLAADRRITDPTALLKVVCDDWGEVEAGIVPCPEIPEHQICCEVKLEGGESVRLIDYASAGKTWDADSQIAAWLRRA